MASKELARKGNKKKCYKSFLLHIVIAKKLFQQKKLTHSSRVPRPPDQLRPEVLEKAFLS